MQLTFIDPAKYPAEASIAFEEIEAAFTIKFVKSLRFAVRAALRKVPSFPLLFGCSFGTSGARTGPIDV